MNFATLPDGPCWAVIFSSQRTPGDAGYEAMAERMAEMTRGQAGFLGMESARDTQGFGITVCYWRSPEDIAAWRMNAEHLQAQSLGYSTWYQHFELRIAQVERAHGMAPKAPD